MLTGTAKSYQLELEPDQECSLPDKEDNRSHNQHNKCPVTPTTPANKEAEAVVGQEPVDEEVLVVQAAEAPPQVELQQSHQQTLLSHQH